MKRHSTWLIGLAGTVLATTALASAPPADAGAAAPTPSAKADPVRRASADHLSSRLSGLVAADAAGKSRAQAASEIGVAASGAGSLLRSTDGSRVLVTVRLASYSESAVDALEAAGAEIVNRNPDLSRVTASVAPADLTDVGSVAGVQYVDDILTPMTNATCDTTISEGDAILKADTERSGKGVNGTGVTVGVLSDSFDTATSAVTHAADDVASDNLPGTANTCNHTSPVVVGSDITGGEDEGRAMAQSIHDLAPGAAIAFQTAFQGEDEFAANITTLAQTAKVIVDDVSYYDEPMYQDGVIANAVTAARDKGVSYFSSAANNRTVLNGNEVGSYEATGGYRPTACPAVLDGQGYLDCQNFNVSGSADPTFSFTSAANRTFQPVLNWAEPFNGVKTDLDLLLVDETSNQIVTSSTETNPGTAGSQKPFEFFNYTVPSSRATHTFGMVVARFPSQAPATPRLKVVFAQNGATPFVTLEHSTPAGGDVMGPTGFGHNDAPATLSVGASSVTVSPSALNRYSSYGPVTQLFAPVNGTTPAAALSTPLTVAKPDFVATDCVKNTFFPPGGASGGVYRFCGTSDSAPHAAAVAALLLSQKPGTTPAQIKSIMSATSAPLPTQVSNAFQGAGLLNATAAGVRLDAPGAAAVAPSLTAITPSSPSSRLVPVITGTADSGSLVTIYASADCSGSPIASGPASNLVSPGLTVTVPANATTTFSARASLPGGTSGCSTTPLSYTNDTVAPASAPTLTSTSPASPNPSTTPTVIGTAETGSTVSLYTTADCSGSPVASGPAATFASSGIAVTVPANSTTTFRATASDTAGNATACSTSSITYVSDSTAPAVPTLTATSPATSGRTTTPTVTGTADAGSTVKLYTSADCTGTAVASGSAAVLASPGITVTVPAGSTTTFRATATDAAGNVSGCSTTSVTYTQQGPAAPTLTGTSPTSPGTSTTPTVIGTALTGATVTIYTAADCSGAAAATGPASTFASPGLTVNVPAGSTRTFYAKQTDAQGYTSPCSTSSVSYTSTAQTTPPAPVVPDTTLTQKPASVVKTKKAKAKVTFAFSSTVAGSTFACSVDGGAYVACSSPYTLKLKAGSHTFAVRATAGGQSDATPATYAFKVKRKHGRR